MSDFSRISSSYQKDPSKPCFPGKADIKLYSLIPCECARLMGFPDSFKISVSDTRAYKQFGNSVVVPVVQEITKSMIECMSNGSRRITLKEYI